MKYNWVIKIFIIMITLFIPKMSFGQGNESNLTIKEYKLLDSLLVNKRLEFSFEGKKVAFISGHSGTDIQSKDDFFKVHILDYLSNEMQPVITYRILKKEEKAESGGYDVIVMQVPKLLTNKQHKANLQNLAKFEEDQ